jgi:hypothetical protein
VQLRRATGIGAVDESTCRKATPPAGKRARFLEGRSCDEGSRGRVNSKVPLPFLTDQPMTLSRSRSCHWPRIPTGSRRKRRLRVHQDGQRERG